MRKTTLMTVVILGLPGISTAYSDDFIKDSHLTGGVYYWQRERDRRDMTHDNANYGNYVTNLTHSTANINLDFSSGYVWDVVGLDLVVFGALEIADAHDSAHPNEMAFSSANRTYDEDWMGDKSGVSLYKAALKFKTGPFWLRAGYIQPTGQTLIAPHWSFMPGTYRGAEMGLIQDYGSYGKLTASYLWSSHYKAPWHLKMDNFRQPDKKTNISYLHGIGAKYDFKNGLALEASMAQAQGYINQYFAKVGWQQDLAGNPLRASYQFYSANNQNGLTKDNKMYDGFAWMQAITLAYNPGVWEMRLEGTAVYAPGNQGFFLKRLTRTYASSNGRLDVYWDNRSDFNAHGEKAVFAGMMYNLINWNLPGLAIGGSVVYGWDIRPSTDPQFDQSKRLTESSVSADARYTMPEGKLRGTQVKLHVTWYNNHSDIPSGKQGFNNLFQDEHDIKLIVIVPFSIF